MFVIKNVTTGRYFAGLINTETFWTPDIEKAKRYANPFPIIELMKDIGWNVTHVLLVKDESQEEEIT